MTTGKYRDIPVFIIGSNYPVTKVENIQTEIEDLRSKLLNIFKMENIRNRQY